MTEHAPRPRSFWRHSLRLAAGVGLVILGIIGLILPIMPGWVFLIPGLLILADYYPPIHRLVHWAKRRMETELNRLRARKP